MRKLRMLATSALISLLAVLLVLQISIAWRESQAAPR